VLTSIQGKSVIVTGGSSGIGKGIARVFANQGAKVLVVARREEVTRQVVENIRFDGGTASYFLGDVRSYKDMENAVQAAIERNGGVDILCANAGIAPSSNLNDMSSEEWDLVLQTNLTGCFNVIKACTPHMQANKWGRIILTSSITGTLTGAEGWSHYGASKSGQVGFMRSVALELALNDITINAILPGSIKIEDMSDEYVQKVGERIPMRKLGRVEDVAYAALFFASEEAAYITGQTIVVDGGAALPEF
jgi:3-oxoacyl-[acyl-carrier protein] reductase